MGLIKMNGVNYWGSAYGQGIIAPMIYSTEEKEVGVWQDGKPLYKRTYSLGSAVIINANTWTSLGIDGSGIDTLVDKECLDDELRSNDVIYCAVSSGYISVYSVISTNIQIITILYTKTTDTAGSGIYTPSGALAVHYSTNEQVIGTWIDGKPLYELTIDIAPLPNNTIKEIQLSADIKKIIYMSGYAWDSNDNWTIYFNDVVPSSLSSSVRVFSRTSTKKIYIQTEANLTSYSEAYVTIQYTKTTDI